jgi:hypothetical protein
MAPATSAVFNIIGHPLAYAAPPIGTRCALDAGTARQVPGDPLCGKAQANVE